MRERSHLIVSAVVAAQTKKGSTTALAGWESSTSASNTKTATPDRASTPTTAAARVTASAEPRHTIPHSCTSTHTMAVASSNTVCEHRSEEDASSGVLQMLIPAKNADERLHHDSYSTTQLPELVVFLEEPLKYNDAAAAIVEHDQQQQRLQEPASKRHKPNGTSTKRRKRCAFNETVRVVPIPLRTEYSHCVRNRIWSNSMEIQENAARNTIEFASEGWDWRAVLLDEAMHHCTTTGELIHPIHYEPHSFLHEDDTTTHPAAEAASCSSSSSDDSSSTSSSASLNSLESTTASCTNSTDE